MTDRQYIYEIGLRLLKLITAVEQLAKHTQHHCQVLDEQRVRLDNLTAAVNDLVLGDS